MQEVFSTKHEDISSKIGFKPYGQDLNTMGEILPKLEDVSFKMEDFRRKRKEISTKWDRISFSMKLH